MAIIGLCALFASSCDANWTNADLVSKSDAGGQANTVRIVGSSTIFPFAAKVAQEVRNKTGYGVVIEATGSGGGHKLFCSQSGLESVDVINSSRRRKPSEKTLCYENGVSGVLEVQIGLDGIVLANAIDAPAFDLDFSHIYLGLAAQVPTSEVDCTLRDNPYRQWSDIDPRLSPAPIRVFGPPPTSGTRDAFVEIMMEAGAGEISCLSELRETDPSGFQSIAHRLREDGRWIDAGENDNTIVQRLVNTPSAIGVFGYSLVSRNTGRIKGGKISGVAPTFKNIASREYPASRPLFFYLKTDNFLSKPALRAYANEFTSERAWGPDGYLIDAGLIPSIDSDRVLYRDAVLSIGLP